MQHVKPIRHLLNILVLFVHVWDIV
jgi:hypothetical protein